MPGAALSLFTICWSPRDYPGLFTCVRHEAGPGWTAARELRGAVGTLAEARRLVPKGLTNIGREPGDEPQIIETWV